MKTEYAATIILLYMIVLVIMIYIHRETPGFIFAERMIYITLGFIGITYIIDKINKLR